MDNNDNIQATGLETTEAPQNTADVEVAVETPVVKTKKELKKERKELKKHKKEVEKEAKKHSAKATKAQRFFLNLISIFVIVAMLVCAVVAIKITKSAGSNSAGSGSANSSSSNTSQTSFLSNSSQSSSSSDSNNAAVSAEPSSGEGSEGTAAAGDLSTKEGVVELYKKAHANVISSAKAVNHTYNNTLNYKDHINVGGNSTIANLAQKLMGMFMKEEKDLATYTGGDIAAKFPGKNVQNLTADMLSEAKCEEKDGKYILTLVVDSTDDNYDLGDKTGCITDIIDEKQITDAAGSFVSLSGLENRYCAATVKATIDKETGNMIEFHSDVPSYMCFGEAKVAIISVKDVSIGLEYVQTWTIEY